MSLFRVYVDGALFYHPQMSKLAITDARIEEDAENIGSMTLAILASFLFLPIALLSPEINSDNKNSRPSVSGQSAVVCVL